MAGPIALHALDADTSLLVDAAGGATLAKWPASTASGGALTLLPVTRETLDTTDPRLLPAHAPGDAAAPAAPLAALAPPAALMLAGRTPHWLGGSVEWGRLMDGQRALLMMSSTTSSDAPPPTARTFIAAAEQAAGGSALVEAAAGGGGVPMGGGGAAPPGYIIPTARGAPPPSAHVEHYSPLLLHAMPGGGADTPAELLVADLAAGSARALPLLPGTPLDDKDERRGADPAVMDVLHAVPIAAGGGALTVHRGGEVVRWRLAKAVSLLPARTWTRLAIRCLAWRLRGRARRARPSPSFRS